MINAEKTRIFMSVNQRSSASKLLLNQKTSETTLGGLLV